MTSAARSLGLLAHKEIKTKATSKKCGFFYEALSCIGK